MIQFRINEKRLSTVNSSTSTSIGLIRCDNFHKIHHDLAEVVDMRVHESIHQVLHLFEDHRHAFVNLEKIPADQLDVKKYPSPWSGQPLDLRSYTHAILVWYGLVHFWRSYLDAGVQHAEITPAQAQAKLNEALFGFANSASVLDNLGPALSWLNPDYADQVRRIERPFKKDMVSNGRTA